MALDKINNDILCILGMVDYYYKWEIANLEYLVNSIHICMKR